MEDFVSHSTTNHPELGGLLGSERQPTSSQCPFCLEKLDTLEETKKHIGQHQLSLALRALGVYSHAPPGRGRYLE